MTSGLGVSRHDLPKLTDEGKASSAGKKDSSMC